MKIKLLTISALFVFASCASCKKVEVEDNSVDVRILKNQIDSLKMEIVELKDQNDNMKDLLRVKEGEVSYWGHKYDSLRDSVNKVKFKK